MNPVHLLGLLAEFLPHCRGSCLWLFQGYVLPRWILHQGYSVSKWLGTRGIIGHTVLGCMLNSCMLCHVSLPPHPDALHKSPCSLPLHFINPWYTLWLECLDMLHCTCPVLMDKTQGAIPPHGFFPTRVVLCQCRCRGGSLGPPKASSCGLPQPHRLHISTLLPGMGTSSRSWRKEGEPRDSSGSSKKAKWR